MRAKIFTVDSSLFTTVGLASLVANRLDLHNGSCDRNYYVPCIRTDFLHTTFAQDRQFGPEPEDMLFRILLRFSLIWEGPNFDLDLVVPNTLMGRLFVLDRSIVKFG